MKDCLVQMCWRRLWCRIFYFSHMLGLVVWKIVNEWDAFSSSVSQGRNNTFNSIITPIFKSVGCVCVHVCFRTCACICLVNYSLTCYWSFLSCAKLLSPLQYIIFNKLLCHILQRRELDRCRKQKHEVKHFTWIRMGHNTWPGCVEFLLNLLHKLNVAIKKSSFPLL